LSAVPIDRDERGSIPSLPTLSRAAHRSGSFCFKSFNPFVGRAVCSTITRKNHSFIHGRTTCSPYNGVFTKDRFPEEQAVSESGSRSEAGIEETFWANNLIALLFAL
jgi:hypothetical protein